MDLRQGIVQHVAIGELAPPFHRDRDGLPVGSLGCEWDEDINEFSRGYNAVVDAVVGQEPPTGASATVEIHNEGDVLTVEIGQITFDSDVVASEIHQRAGLVFLGNTLVQGTETVCTPESEWRVTVGEESACWAAADPTFAPLQNLSQALFDVAPRD